MIKAAIAGATGYAGNELVRILTNHPDVEIKALLAHSYVGKRFDEVYENYRDINNMVCEEMNIDKLADECDVIFMALPHGVASNVVN